MKENILLAKGVWKTYREGNQEIPVLWEVDIDVYQGEQIGIMGPSGSGKTTFLNVVSGLDDVTKGTLVSIGRRAIVETMVPVWNRILLSRQLSRLWTG